MALFFRQSSSSAALSVLLLATGCSTVPAPPTQKDPSPVVAPPREKAPPVSFTNAVDLALTRTANGKEWTAQADFPSLSDFRLLVTLEAGLASANPGEEIDVIVLAAPAGPARAAQASVRVLDEQTTQQFFVGGVTNLPAGSLTLRMFTTDRRSAGLAVSRCELRAVPAEQAAGIDERRNYPGQSPRAAWRTAAAARIEELRKAPARITVQDAAGAPLRSAMVELTLQQPALRIAAQAPTRPEAPPPRESLVNAWLAQVGPGWDTPPTPTPANAVIGFMEGGVLLPLSNSRNHPLEDTSLSPAQKLAALKKRIADTLAPFAQADMNWDLSDGLSRHVEALESLSPDVLAGLLAAARKTAPKAKIFLHDFGVLEGGVRRLNDFRQKVVELQGSGVRLDGLSVTLEAFRSPPAPAEVVARLERLAESNLPLRIAPLGFVGAFAPETARAAAADLLLAVFSQPAVQSVVIARADQAPWDEVLRNPPSPLKEWIPGQKYKARTDAEGRVVLRVPAGRYAVSVSTPRGLQRTEMFVVQTIGGAVDVRVPSTPKPAAAAPSP